MWIVSFHCPIAGKVRGNYPRSNSNIDVEKPMGFSVQKTITSMGGGSDRLSLTTYQLG